MQIERRGMLRSEMLSWVGLAFSLLAAAACGGGAQTASSDGGTLVISHFILSPRGAYLNSGSGTTLVGGQVFFSATGSSPTSATITTRAANGTLVSSQTIPIGSAAIGSSGTVTGTATVGTGIAGLFSVEVFLSNAAGSRSNVLTAPFTIAPFPWTTAIAMPALRINAAAVAVDNRIFVIGGSDGLAPVIPKPPTPTVQVFDAITGNWSAGVALPIPIEYPSAAVVGGNIYVVAGRTTAGSCSQISNVYSFDAGAGLWTQRAAIPVPAFASTASVIGTKIYVVGGDVAGICPDRPTPGVWVYDTASDSWSSAADRPAATVQLGAGAVNGKIVTFGGFYALDGGSGGVNALAEYDPATDAWTPKSAALGGGAVATVPVGGLLYAIGGMTSIGTILHTVSAYDAATDTVRRLEPLPSTAIVLGPVAASYRGIIYVFDSTTTWVYAPQNDIN